MTKLTGVTISTRVAEELRMLVKDMAEAGGVGYGYNLPLDDKQFLDEYNQFCISLENAWARNQKAKNRKNILSRINKTLSNQR